MTYFNKYLAAVAAIALTAGCGDKTEKTEATAAPSTEAPAEVTAAKPQTDGASTASVIAPAHAPEIHRADLAAHINTLASDEFQGRAPVTPGGRMTRDYIAAEFERIGLEPLNGSYEQAVPIVEATLDPDTSFVRVNANGRAIDLEYKKDMVIWTKRVEENLSFSDSEMIFVGYGVVAPEFGWNDYDGIDVTGKTVVILVNDPGFATQDEALFNGNAMTYYGRWTYKYEEAARQGAAAALVIHDTAPAAYGWGVVEGSWSGPQLDLETADRGAGRVIAEGWLTNETARSLMNEAGLDLDALQQAAISPEFTAVSMEGLTASAKLNTAIRRSESANVLGVLRGSEAPDEYLLYMGHWDHLGLNQTETGEDKIFNGAVDNATGIAAILEIAEKFATNDEPPKRSILFAAVTAEESGLLGSAYMAEDPPVPLKQIVGGINIDAVLPSPLTKDIIVVGSSASELEDLLKAAAENHDRYLRPDPEPEKGYFYRSDHISLAKKGVPMLYADSGIDLRDGGEEAGRAFGADYVENRYHKPADEYNGDWDLTGMIDTVEVLYETGAAIAYSDKWPNWYEGNEFRALRDAQRGE